MADRAGLNIAFVVIAVAMAGMFRGADAREWRPAAGEDQNPAGSAPAIAARRSLRQLDFRRAAPLAPFGIGAPGNEDRVKSDCSMYRQARLDGHRGDRRNAAFFACRLHHCSACPARCDQDAGASKADRRCR